MGFVKKIISPSVPQSITSVSAPPPVVADTLAHDTGAAYEQKAARKKGLLSTLLSKQSSQAARTSPAEHHSTLG